jgi:hypothetical protein
VVSLPDNLISDKTGLWNLYLMRPPVVSLPDENGLWYLYLMRPECLQLMKRLWYLFMRPDCGISTYLMRPDYSTYLYLMRMDYGVST